MQVKVSDLSGFQNMKPQRANEVGLMVRSPGRTDQSDELLQNGIMLGWGIGNIITNLQDGRRMQQSNNMGYAFFPYLQIQCEGNTFFVRGSNDGKKRTELPGSPYNKQQWKGKLFQIGPYHASYGKNKGYGSFSEWCFYENH